MLGKWHSEHPSRAGVGVDSRQAAGAAERGTSGAEPRMLERRSERGEESGSPLRSEPGLGVQCPDNRGACYEMTSANSAFISSVACSAHRSQSPPKRSTYFL